MSDTTIAATSLVADLQPYVVALAGAVVSASMAFGIALFSKWLGLKIDDATSKDAEAYLVGLVQKAIAGASDNLATAKIDVHSTIVKALVDEALNYGPQALGKIGFGPDAIAARLVSIFGGLQASMTRVSPAQTAPAK